jgi:hypothetical protein
MPVGPLILFIVIAIVVAAVIVFALMPPNKFVEKTDRGKKRP